MIRFHGRGVNFWFECGAFDKVRPVLCNSRVYQFAVGGVLDGFAPAEVAFAERHGPLRTETTQLQFSKTSFYL
jgi:hypothetical protein